VGGVKYNYVLGNGNYMMPSLDGPTIVTGDAVLYVTDVIKFGGKELIILPGASLTLYYGGTDADFGTILNQNTNPSTFQLYGLSSTTGVVGISGTDILTGVIYAPHAMVQMSGGGTIYGSVSAKSGKLNGNAMIHYDESLRNLPRIRGVIAASWIEL
jgi:hypothetical protein